MPMVGVCQFSRRKGNKVMPGYGDWRDEEWIRLEVARQLAERTGTDLTEVFTRLRVWQERDVFNADMLVWILYDGVGALIRLDRYDLVRMAMGVFSNVYVSGAVGRILAGMQGASAQAELGVRPRDDDYPNWPLQPSAKPDCPDPAPTPDPSPTPRRRIRRYIASSSP